MNNINDSVFKIEVDQVNRIITVGAWSVSTAKYYRGLTKESNISLKLDILNANAISIETHDIKKEGSIFRGIKVVHAEIHKYLGSCFYKRLMAISIDLWITPIRHHLDKFCFYSTGYSHYYSVPQISRTWRHIKKVESGAEDGIDNVMPFIIYLGCSPRVLKRNLGKSIWKKLCKKSITSNKLIVSILERELGTHSRIGSVRKFDAYLPILSILASLKSSLILYIERNDYKISGELDVLMWLNANSLVSKERDVSKMRMIYKDTRSMAKQLGYEFKPWNSKSMQKRHSKYLRYFRTKNYPDSKFKWMEKIDLMPNKVEEVEIRLLDSPKSVAVEGFELSHCIASYVGMIHDRSYIAFSLKYSDIRSTLGINCIGGSLVIDQHYGNFNRDVESPILTGAADHILSFLKRYPKLLDSPNEDY